MNEVNKKIKSKISVIVPCYNNEKYVNKCLLSLKNQTFEDFEVIIINDGSKDNSQAVIESFIKDDLRFSLINQENKGVSFARNVGLQQANGTYVCFVDADDYLEENYLKFLIEGIEDNNCDLSICSVIHEDLSQKVILIDQLQSAILTSQETANLEKLVWGYACNKLYKMDLIRKHNLAFDPTIKFAEDELFYLHYLFKSSRVCFIDTPLYHYVRQNNSATKNKSNLSVQANRFISRQMIINLLKENNVDSKVIDKHIVGCVDTCLLLLAYKYKDQKLTKVQKQEYVKYIKENKKIYLSKKDINWKAKLYLKLACFSTVIYKPIRRLQLKLTHRI